MKDQHTDPRETAPAGNRLTAADWQRIRERHVEVMTERKTASDLNLVAALRLGHALRQRGQQGEG